MDCREFQDIVVDLVRGRLGDAAVWTSAQAHARECEPCASRLAAEEQFAETSAALRAQDAGLQAPPRLEDSLLREFQRSSSQRQVQGSSSRRARAGWSVAAAAAAGFALWAGLIRQQPSSPAGESVDLKLPAAAERAAQPAPPSQAEPAAASQGSPEIEPSRAAARTEPRASRRRSMRPEAPALAATREVVTDFVPLTYSSLATTRLVRVRLPSTALLYFGLPAPPDAASASVEADVLLGEDGLAQAVRFVRPVAVRASAAGPTGSRQLR